MENLFNHFKSTGLHIIFQLDRIVVFVRDEVDYSILMNQTLSFMDDGLAELSQLSEGHALIDLFLETIKVIWDERLLLFLNEFCHKINGLG